MVIEIILLVLGILTLALGIWNVVIGAFVWGGLFLLGGLWSVSLGIIYIRQSLKMKRQAKEKEKALEIIDLAQSPKNDFVEVTEVKTELAQDDQDNEEIEKAVSFTNDVIPTSKIEGKDLEELDENTQLITEIDEIDPDVEILQDIVLSDTDSQNNKEERPNNEG